MLAGLMSRCGQYEVDGTDRQEKKTQELQTLRHYLGQIPRQRLRFRVILCRLAEYVRKLRMQRKIVGHSDLACIPSESALTTYRLTGQTAMRQT